MVEKKRIVAFLLSLIVFHQMNAILGGVSRNLWFFYKATRWRWIYIIDKFVVWHLWYYWDELIYGPIIYRVWWPIKYGLRPYYDWVLILSTVGLLSLLKKYKKRIFRGRIR